LDSYLRGPFLADFEELRKVRHTADQALETLDRFNHNAEWPYEISQGSSPEPSTSQSTAAMILFSMAVVIGKLSSVLVPTLSARNLDDMPANIRALHDRVGNSIEPNLAQLLKNVNASRRSRTRFKVSNSRTFGPDDPFTLLWLIELLGMYCQEEPFKASYRNAIDTANKRITEVFKSAEPAFAALKAKRPLEHVFPVLRVVQLNESLRARKEGGTELYAQLIQYLLNRLHLHLSYFSIPESSYDAAELAFSMEAILLLDQNALDSSLVERCLHVLDQSQRRNPYWRPLRPFIANPQGMVLLPLSVEIANSLMRSCEILDERDRSQRHISRYIDLFRKYTDWLFTRIVIGRTKEDKPFLGWHSEHADDPGKIHLWETSQVLLCLSHYEALLRRFRAATSLNLMGLNTGREPTPQHNPLERWIEGPQLREPLMGLPESSECAIYHRIAEAYIAPRTVGGNPLERHYSMLLYGPQGTGKTTLAEEVAGCLGQRLIIITPSDFTVRGGAQVEARAKALFDILGAQTDVVILLDEIDRLILDRDSKSYQKQSDLFQFMTPGMLTKFRNLRREQRALFIVSTNYAERIDPAIKRRGRIDDQYVVMPPDNQQRRNIILKELRSLLLLFPLMIPSETELNTSNITAITALFIPAELQNMAQRAARAAKSRAKGELLEALVHEATNIEPAIRLGAYRARFKWGRDNTDELEFNQEPFTEFLFLLYLVIESGRAFTKDESALMNKCARDFPAEPREMMKRLSDYIKDTHVSQTVFEAFTEALK
jgi:hypothetical protein